jgi:hypothetical protein
VSYFPCLSVVVVFKTLFSVTRAWCYLCWLAPPFLSTNGFHLSQASDPFFHFLVFSCSAIIESFLSLQSCY